jgi:hypothetical protein
MRIPIGVQLALPYDPAITPHGYHPIDNPNDPLSWHKLTDHNRQPIGISYDLIENTQRMANGILRKYVVARKFKITTAWQDLPSLDSNLVDYSSGVTTTTVSTTTNQVVAANSENTVTGTWSNMISDAAGNVFFYSDTLPDRIGRSVTIAGVSPTITNDSNQLGNGTYVVSSIQSPLKAKATSTGSSTVITLTNQTYVIGSSTIGQGMAVSGSGIPSGTQVVSVSVNGNVVTLNQAVNLATPTDLVFGGISQGYFSVKSAKSGISGITGTYSYVLSHPIAMGVSLDKTDLTKITIAVNNQLDIPTQGQTITLYNTLNANLDGQHVVDSVSTAPMSFTVIIPGGIGTSGTGLNTGYWLPGVQTPQSTPTTTTVISTNTNNAHGGAWIKAFYEANAFQPVYVKLIYAQDTIPAEGSVPDSGTYKDSKQTSGQIFESYMSSFNYDIKKRRGYNSANALNTGYDYVDLKIEFTEI